MNSRFVVLWTLIPSKLKSIIVDQSIVQVSTSWSVIAPMLFGYGVTLNYTFGLKWLPAELVDVNWLFAIIKSYVKVNFKEIITIII